MAYYCRYKTTAAYDTCFNDKIEIEALKEVLLASIQRLQDALRGQKKTASEKAAVPSVDYVKEIASLQREIERTNSEKLALYNAYSDEKISREKYIKGRDSAGESIRSGS